MAAARRAKTFRARAKTMAKAGLVAGGLTAGSYGGIKLAEAVYPRFRAENVPIAKEIERFGDETRRDIGNLIHRAPGAVEGLLKSAVWRLLGAGAGGLAGTYLLRKAGANKFEAKKLKKALEYVIVGAPMAFGAVNPGVTIRAVAGGYVIMIAYRNRKGIADFITRTQGQNKKLKNQGSASGPGKQPPNRPSPRRRKAP